MGTPGTLKKRHCSSSKPALKLAPKPMPAQVAASSARTHGGSDDEEGESVCPDSDADKVSTKLEPNDEESQKVVPSLSATLTNSDHNDDGDDDGACAADDEGEEEGEEEEALQPSDDECISRTVAAKPPGRCGSILVCFHINVTTIAFVVAVGLCECFH